MKLDWSKILVIAMSLFIIMIVAMGIRMATSGSTLYEKDYYRQGEGHELRMEQEKVAKAINFDYNIDLQVLSLTSAKGKVMIQSVKCIYMADSKKDKLYKLKPNSGAQASSIELPLSVGNWMLEVEGTLDQKAFFKKLNVRI